MEPSQTRQALVAVVILVLGSAAALAIRFSGERTTSTLSDEPPRELAVVTKRSWAVPLRVPVTVAGRSQARREVDLAAEIPGRLLKVHADVGDRLSRDALAFELDARDAGLAVEDRRARLEAARARHRQAQRRAERREELGDAGISAPEAVEEAALDQEVTGADLVVAEKNLHLAERELEKTRITAPWSGVVVRRDADPGAWLTPGQRVLRLVDLSRLDVEVDLPASDAAFLRVGDTATVRFAALPGEVFEGEIRFIAAESSNADLQVPIAVALSNDDQRLRAGLVAEARFDLARSGDGVAVPLEALDRRAGDHVWEWVESRVYRRPVLVAATRGGQAILSSGLDADARVVVSSMTRLTDGTLVDATSSNESAETTP